MLKQEPYPLPRSRQLPTVERRDVFAFDEHTTGIRPEQPDHMLQRDAFSRAASSQQTKHRGARNGEGNVVQHALIGKRLGYALEPNGGFIVHEPSGKMKKISRT